MARRPDSTGELIVATSSRQPLRDLRHGDAPLGRCDGQGLAEDVGEGRLGQESRREYRAAGAEDFQGDLPVQGEVAGAEHGAERSPAISHGGPLGTSAQPWSPPARPR